MDNNDLSTQDPFESDDEAAENEEAESGEFRTGGKNRFGITRIKVSDAPGAAKFIYEELGRNKLSGLYRREDQLVFTPRTGEDGYVPASKEDEEDGPAQVRSITPGRLAALLDLNYDPGIVKKHNDKPQWLKRLMPAGITARVLDMAGLRSSAPNLRTLRGISHTPFLRVDGSIFDTPGYDPVSGTLYLPRCDVPSVDQDEDARHFKAVPEEPTRAQIEAARDFILKPIRLYPFVTPDDQANWVGCALTPLLRPLVPPPYQFGIFDAPSPGSGKTNLIKTLGEIHGLVMRVGMPERPEEWPKTITTILASTTAPVVAFDNVRGKVYSQAFEGVLTSDRYADRRFGRNDEPMHLKNDRLWVMSGNNATIGGDLGRRSFRISIDPGVPNPEMRRFPFDSVEWMRRNRDPYIVALLTVARAWIVAGRPMPDYGRSDSYAAWIRTVRGILAFAGFDGTFVPESRAEVSEEDREWGDFLEAVQSVNRDETFSARELMDKFGTIGDKIPLELLPGDLATKFNDPGRFMKSLGLWLKNHKNRYANGLRLVEMGKGTSGMQKNVQTYRVEEAEVTTGSDVEPGSEPF